MSLITARGLAKSYGAVTIFSGVTGRIPPSARIALVGPNGVGKTTLLRILAGFEEPSSGTVQRARQLNLGYLSQEAATEAAGTLWSSCLEAFADLRAREVELARLERDLSRNPRDAELLERCGTLRSAFGDAGGYTYETRIRQILGGLGFRETDYALPIEKLSGGQQTRARLARLLLQSPALLMLDEPTNHLDIAAVEWLEEYLRNWRGAALIVSHDRYFLDRVVDHVWEMRSLGLEMFRGNYSAYLQQREARWGDRARFIEAEKERLAKELDFIRRNMAGQLSVQAKGRLRRVSRMIRAIETHGFEGVRGRRWIEIGSSELTLRPDEAARRLKALGGTDHESGTMKPAIRPRRRGGNIVLRAHELEVGYPGRMLFHAEKLLLRRQERVAIVGGNGSGKTTFLRTLLDQVQPLRGELRQGENLDLGYFTQAHEDLDPARTLIEEISSAAPSLLPSEVRGYLGRFRFSGDDHFKTVSVLSGGERGRLALAKLGLSHANLLLLDEPTNHLDLPSQEVLQQMLAEYEGTILLVSHDRYLISALATQVWAIDAARRRLEVFEGTYPEYRAAQEATAAATIVATASESLASALGTRVQPGTHGDVGWAGPRSCAPLSKARRRERHAEIAAVESQIAELERRLAATRDSLASPPSDPMAIRRLGESYELLRAELEALIGKWEALHS